MRLLNEITSLCYICSFCSAQLTLVSRVVPAATSVTLVYIEAPSYFPHPRVREGPHDLNVVIHPVPRGARSPSSVDLVQPKLCDRAACAHIKPRRPHMRQNKITTGSQQTWTLPRTAVRGGSQIPSKDTHFTHQHRLHIKVSMNRVTCCL